jgi:hypothetical protein
MTRQVMARNTFIVLAVAAIGLGGCANLPPEVNAYLTKQPYIDNESPPPAPYYPPVAQVQESTPSSVATDHYPDPAPLPPIIYYNQELPPPPIICDPPVPFYRPYVPDVYTPSFNNDGDRGDDNDTDGDD